MVRYKGHDFLGLYPDHVVPNVKKLFEYIPDSIPDFAEQ